MSFFIRSLIAAHSEISYERKKEEWLSEARHEIMLHKIAQCSWIAKHYILIEMI